MSYVDGFLVPVPKDNVKAYIALSKKAGKIWLEHGALEYRECLGDDLNIPNMLSFNKVAKTKENETVIFAFIVYKSKAHRNQVNAKVMSDPRLADMCDPNWTAPGSKVIASLTRLAAVACVE